MGVGDGKSNEKKENCCNIKIKLYVDIIVEIYAVRKSAVGSERRDFQMKIPLTSTLRLFR